MPVLGLYLDAWLRRHPSRTGRRHSNLTASAGGETAKSRPTRARPARGQAAGRLPRRNLQPIPKPRSTQFIAIQEFALSPIETRLARPGGKPPDGAHGGPRRRGRGCADAPDARSPRMSENPLHIAQTGAILEITLDMPKANAISAATSRIMGQAFRCLPRRPSPARRHHYRCRRKILLRRLGPERRRGRRTARCRLRRRRFRRLAGTARPQQTGDRRCERHGGRRRLRTGPISRHDPGRRPRPILPCQKSRLAHWPTPPR